MLAHPYRTARRRRWPVAAALLAVAVAATTGTAYADHRTVSPRRAAVAADASPSAAAAPATVPAGADAYVVAERPSNSYGTEVKLTAANWTTWHSETYLRFTVPATPAGSTIASVRLELSVQRVDTDPARLDLRPLTGSWSETVTYATRPTAGAVVAGATPPASGQPWSFDLSSVVTAAGPVNLAVTNPTAQSVASVHAREHGADGPRLVITYDDPTPTLCGASFADEGLTYQQALAREDGFFNGLEMVRVFYPGLPQAWPGKLDTSGRPMAVSFKATPAEVVAGTHDARLRTWFATAPRDQDIYWTYYHEPEEDWDTATEKTQYRQAWQRLSGLADQAANPRLRATLILMGWSLNPNSGRNWRDWYPGRAYLDVLGWDLYNPSWNNPDEPAYKAPSELFANVIATSDAEGLPFGIGETGSPLIPGDSGTQRAAWLRALSAHLTAAGALFVAYFDHDWPNADYRLRDPAGQAAWAEFCS
jgi:hypothetical protein